MVEGPLSSKVRDAPIGGSPKQQDSGEGEDSSKRIAPHGRKKKAERDRPSSKWLGVNNRGRMCSPLLFVSESRRSGLESLSAWCLEGHPAMGQATIAYRYLERLRHINS
jgi:hypothetical protein